MDLELKGKVAIVGGASKGLGRACADVLAEEGYAYSSSVYPVRHDNYGIPEAPRTPFRPANAPGLVELTLPTLSAGSRNLPAGGGGFFRLLPYAADTVKRDALAAADLFVMPSRTDSFGIVYLEAWCYGVPVIGAPSGVGPGWPVPATVVILPVAGSSLPMVPLPLPVVHTMPCLSTSRPCGRWPEGMSHSWKVLVFVSKRATLLPVITEM